LIDEWVMAIGLRPEEYGTHSLRRTKAALIFKATGKSRVDIDDALTLAERTEI